MSGPRRKQSGSQRQGVVKEPGDDRRLPDDLVDADDPQRLEADEANAAVELAVVKPQNPGSKAQSASLKEMDIERDEVDPEMEEKMAKYVRGNPIRVQVSRP